MNISKSKTVTKFLQRSYAMILTDLSNAIKNRAERKFRFITTLTICYLWRIYQPANRDSYKIKTLPFYLVFWNFALEYDYISLKQYLFDCVPSQLKNTCCRPNNGKNYKFICKTIYLHFQFFVPITQVADLSRNYITYMISNSCITAINSQ